MKITSEIIKDGIIVITISGQVVGEYGSEMRRKIKEVIEGLPEGQPPKLILSLDGVSVDSVGLGALVSLDMMVKKQRGKFMLVKVSQELTGLFVITKLTKVFDIYSTVEDAMAALNEKSALV